jgi:hypothetical protein
VPGAPAEAVLPAEGVALPVAEGAALAPPELGAPPPSCPPDGPPPLVLAAMTGPGGVPFSVQLIRWLSSWMGSPSFRGGLGIPTALVAVLWSLGIAVVALGLVVTRRRPTDRVPR